MSGRKTGGKLGTNNTGISIPPSDRKLISSLKEVVPHSEEEIYSMFTECNRDPDETVQRLLSEETFHVVQRKQTKKKESIKDATGAQHGSGSLYDASRKSSRIARSRDSGRGSSVLKGYGSAETNGVSSKVTNSREIGIPPVVNIKGPSSAVGGTVSYSQLVQTKSSLYTNRFENPLSSGQPDEYIQAVSSHGPLPIGSSSLPTLQGAWLGSGHGTVADMLKSKSTINTPPNATLTPSNTTMEYQSVQNVYLASSDVPNPSFNPPARNSAWAVKEDIDAVRTQWVHVDRSSFALQDMGAHVQNSLSSVDSSVSVHVEEETSKSSAFIEGLSQTMGISEAPEAQTVVSGSQFMATSYQAEQLVEVHKDSLAMENSYQEVITEEIPPIEASPVENETKSSIEMLSVTTERLQELSMRETQQVIIPDHIRVSEEDCTMLSFGSFDFGRLPSNFRTEKESISPQLEEGTDEEDLGVTSGSPESSMSNVNPTRLDGEEAEVSVSSQQLDTVADTNAALNNEVEIKKDEPFEQAQSQHAYTSGYSIISQPLTDHTAEYPTEVMDTRQTQDINTVLQQPYDTSTYYSGMFRTVPEVDARYSAFLPSASNLKLSGGSRPVPTIQNAPSQEAANATTVFSNSTSIGGQNMQVPNNAPAATTITLPQQTSHPVYATQPSGMPMGPFANVFSYQYMPPGFSYLQNPYQQGYLGSGNYQQVPSTVGAGMKYPLPQYKQGGAVVSGLHTAMNPGNLGYGGYNNTLSQPGAFPVNTQGTPRNPSSYDEAPSPQFKETNVYMPSQQAQMEAPSVWLQSQSARDVQNSSYYNVPTPNQHQQTRYSHQTQSLQTHTHPGAPATMYGGNVYHHQQSSSSPSAHQLLQQQQGSVGALGTRIGSYQQGQRSQQSWANGI